MLKDFLESLGNGSVNNLAGIRQKFKAPSITYYSLMIILLNLFTLVSTGQKDL